MNWFFVYFLVMGIVLGIVPTIIMKNIKNAVDIDYPGRNKAFEKANTWLLVYAWVAVFISAGFSVQLGVGVSKDLEKIENRIESVEEQITLPSIDTVYVIKDLPKDE